MNGPVAYTGYVATTVYRTQGGIILRVTEAEDGGLKVETLTDGAWVAGPIGMVGLRLSPTTSRLTAREIRGFPE